MPMRIFPLEFIRKSVNVDDVHFFPSKNGYMFNLGKPICPFIANSRQAFQVAKKLMKEMNFDMGDVWHYDRHGVIAKKREITKSSTYYYECRPEIEWKANLDSWPINIDMDIDTPLKNHKAQKRTIVEIGYVETKDVKTRKKAKT